MAIKINGTTVIDDNKTLVNSRINPRTSAATITSVATLTPDVSTYDQYNITAQAVALTIGAPIGTPVDGNKLIIRVTDNGTAQTIAWNAVFNSLGSSLPTTTVAAKTLYIGAVYNQTTAKWDVVVGSALTKSDVGLANVDNTSDATKSVASAAKWTTARTQTLSGDISGSASVDGSANWSITTTLANSGVTAGTYVSVTVDAKGRATSGSTTQAWSTITGTPTTVSGYGITDAYTKTEVDSLVQGLDPKGSVKVATTVNITLSGTQTIDGVALAAGDRVLVKDQTTTSANGIYVVSATAWSRATDMDAWTEIPGAYVFAEQGTVNAEMGFVCTSDQGGTIGTTAVTFVQFTGAGQITAGTGLAKSGNTLSIANTAVSAGSFGSASSVGTFTVNAQGQLTAAASTAISFPVTSVAGKTGAVTLSTTDVSEGTNLYYTNARASAAAPVQSVFGRTGAVTLLAADVPTLNQNTTGTASNVTGTVAIANGGTGQTTANSAFNALAPSQTGNSGKYLVTDGTNISWATVQSGAALSNDTTTATNLYPIFANATTGAPTTVYTSNAKYLYKPSTGELKASQVVATNGIFVNATTVSSSYVVETGFNAHAIGPVTVASGQSVTVSAGQRFLVM